MTAIEVLAPLRLETRFRAPELAGGAWWLRLRVYPDDFSMAHGELTPSADELDLLDAALAADVDEPAAFATLAAAVGGPRAAWLFRTVPITLGADGIPHANLTPPPRPNFPPGAVPLGLPPELEVRLVSKTPGVSYPVTTLTLDRAGIAADMQPKVFEHVDTSGVPATWWLSFARARDVGLGAEIDLGPDVPDLASVVVVGRGDQTTDELVERHIATGRLVAIPQGTPTNTVEGEPTTDLGHDPAHWYPYAHIDPTTEPGLAAVCTALRGTTAPTPDPHRDRGAGLVRGLWPALWGRQFRDVLGAHAIEYELADWAAANLAVEGPYPAIRVGDQPYGLLPATVLGEWVPDAGDPPVEPVIVDFAQRWRDTAASATTKTQPTVVAADTDALLERYGSHAPNRHWGARPVRARSIAGVLAAGLGFSASDTHDWSKNTADALGGDGFEQYVAPVWFALDLPDARDDNPDALIEMLFHTGEEIPQHPAANGLFGHLLREAVVIGRWRVGQTFRAVSVGHPLPVQLPVVPSSSDPLFYSLLVYGADQYVDIVAAHSDPSAAAVARRFVWWRERLIDFIENYWRDESLQPASFAALLAALDTASFRVDPWVTGIADRRLRQMVTEQVPFQLGAYGWVDDLAPATDAGPTKAGLLHAPSTQQARTAALLRDAAVRYPAEDRWKITLDSAKVRPAARLAERVRLGVHPYEALGLEVERIAGDWDTVRALREAFPLVDGDDAHRTCDGVRALEAIRRDAETVSASLAALKGKLAVLDDALDTYADLLLADGVHALVCGQTEIGHAAMEAAAGLGAPPDLRCIRTPHSGTDVRTTVWIVLDAAAAESPAGTSDPRVVADPAYDARYSRLLGGGDENAPDLDIGGAVGNLVDRHARLVELLDALRLELQTDDDRARPKLASWSIDTDRDDWSAAATAELARRAGAHGNPASTVGALRKAIRGLVGDPMLPVLPIVGRSALPRSAPAPTLDRTWLPYVAAVRPRMANIEAWQLDPERACTAGMSPEGATNPWTATQPLTITYRPSGGGHSPLVAVVPVDTWTDAVPSRRHSTAAAFGFNGPRSRAPQAVLLAVPPDRSQRLTNEGLYRVVLETRRTARARVTSPLDGPQFATPAPLLSTDPNDGFLERWA